MVPPQFLDEEDGGIDPAQELAQAKQIIEQGTQALQQMQQRVQEMGQELQQTKAQLADRQMDMQVKGAEAELKGQELGIKQQEAQMNLQQKQAELKLKSDELALKIQQAADAAREAEMQAAKDIQIATIEAENAALLAKIQSGNYIAPEVAAVVEGMAAKDQENTALLASALASLSLTLERAGEPKKVIRDGSGKITGIQ